MGILSIDIEWIKCVSAPWAIHAMGHILTGLTGPFLAELGISASCASSVLIIDLRLCACV